jgi:hypothetical protein
VAIKTKVLPLVRINLQFPLLAFGPEYPVTSSQRL